MTLTNKTILLISPEPWDHIFVSKHHYAVQLGCQGNKVFFLNPPGGGRGVLPTRFESVFQIRYGGFPPLMRFYPESLQRLVLAYVYKRLEQVCQERFDVIWSFDNSVFFNFAFLDARVLKISHIVDINQDFQTAKAAATADFCFCTTELIRRRLSRFNANVHIIDHGYHHVPQKCPEGLKPAHARKAAVYAGNLSIAYIDWRILATVISNHTDVDFVFIGPNDNHFTGDPLMQSAKERVFKSSNVIFKGEVDFEELQTFYASADVLLIAYQEKYQGDQVANPHKMVEYLGSGKVVVATYTSRYVNFHPLIVMSQTNLAWIANFASVVANLDFYNSESLQKKRRQFALSNTYENQIRRIENFLTAHDSR